MSNHKWRQEEVINRLTRENTDLGLCIDKQMDEIFTLKDEINELDVLVHDQQKEIRDQHKIIRSLLHYKHAHNTLMNLLNQG